MIIQESTLSSLLSQWKERLSDEHYSEEYRCALGECLYDLQTLIDNNTSDQEFMQDVIANLPSTEIEDYLMGLEADEELSMVEAHETVA